MSEVVQIGQWTHMDGATGEVTRGPENWKLRQAISFALWQWATGNYT